MTTLLIAGSRTFAFPRRSKAEAAVFRIFDMVAPLIPGSEDFVIGPCDVLHGGAYGADELGGRWGHYQGQRVRIIRPDWERYGHIAGFVRNDALVGECDGAIVLWDGKSNGTKDTIGKLVKAEKPHVVVVRSLESFL